MRIHVSNTYDDHILQDLIKHMYSTNIVFMHAVKCVANYYYYKKCVTQSRTGLQIYEGHDDQLNRPGPMA
jgi:hypothetical protein